VRIYQRGNSKEKVYLKELTTIHDEEFNDNLTEIQAQMSLSHPNLLKINGFTNSYFFLNVLYEAN
jgi:hypothetical protein